MPATFSNANIRVIETTTVNICHGCACVIANGEGAPENEEAVEAIGGYFVVVDHDGDTESRPSGCFDCFICDEIVYEHPHVAEWEHRAG